MRLSDAFRLDEGETIPMGRCFQWALAEYMKNHLDDPQAYLVHARVTPPGHSDPYWHAWVETQDHVYDWQTTELGTSKYAGRGWPKTVFYREFQPSEVRRYQGPVGKLLTQHGHAGPWTTNESFEISEIGFGLKFLRGAVVSLAGGQRSGNSPPGHTRLKYAVYRTADLRQNENDPEPNEVGFIELIVRDGTEFDVTGMVKIDIKERGQGIGTEVVRQILDTVKHDILIYDIGVYRSSGMPVKSGTARALAFWNKLGVVGVNGKPLTDRHGQFGILRYGDGSAPLPDEVIPKSAEYSMSIGSKPGRIKLKGFRTESLGEAVREVDPFEDSEKARAFNALADAQRGEPELAMARAQELFGGGVMNAALEHIGDLTHRMAEKSGRFGSEFVRPKVEQGLRVLTHGYGFEREFRENIVSNNRFRREHPEYEYPEVTPARERTVLGAYWHAHARLPVYNRMQECARNAAVYLGQLRFSESVACLREIDMAIKDGTYDEKSQQYDPNYPGRVFA